MEEVGGFRATLNDVASTLASCCELCGKRGSCGVEETAKTEARRLARPYLCPSYEPRRSSGRRARGTLLAEEDAE